MEDDIYYKEIEIVLKAILKAKGEIKLSDKSYLNLVDNKEKIHLEYIHEDNTHKVYLK